MGFEVVVEVVVVVVVVVVVGTVQNIGLITSLLMQAKTVFRYMLGWSVQSSAPREAPSASNEQDPEKQNKKPFEYCLRVSRLNPFLL